MTHSTGVTMYGRQKAAYENSIPVEELPVRAGLTVIRTCDPNFGLSEDEIADRNEFIHCYLMREFELLVVIPATKPDSDFFIPDCYVTDDAYSAFNTVDFELTVRPFDRYGYAIKKMMERVKDLAILHSAVSHEAGRRNLARRFESFVDYEFRDPLLHYVDRFKSAVTEAQKEHFKKKIGEMNHRILEAKRIWERYAPWDT